MMFLSLHYFSVGSSFLIIDFRYILRILIVGNIVILTWMQPWKFIKMTYNYQYLTL